jgi:phenylpropionate dioxygenase-like ring-hydroxylating dioxygenase large terminal subunit
MSVHTWAHAHPELDTELLPVEPYISEQAYQLEQERVFRRAWLNVGRLDDVPEPGSYFVREVAVAHVSVLITHGKDGQIRAFHNVCSHRGNKVVWGRGGKCNGYLSCCFHGWTYDLEGRLVSVLDEKNFFDIDKDTLGLTPIRCEVWNGFIFVNLSEQPSETLEEFLAGLAYRFDGAELDAMRLSFRYDVEEATNWKVALDAQNEIYHLPVLGPVHGSFGEYFAADQEGCTRITEFERVGRHTMYSTTKNPEYEAIGLEPVIDTIPGAEPDLALRGTFDFYVIFPNMVLAFFPGLMWTYNFWPLAYDRTGWEIRLYYPEPRNGAEFLAQAYRKAKLRDALAEDIAGHENVFAGLRSGAKKNIVLQDDEIQIRSFYRNLQEYIQQ